MAVKDWKKTKRKDLWKTIITTVGIAKYKINDRTDRYEVVTGSGSNIQAIRTFKTRRQALKFVKSYMKKH